MRKLSAVILSIFAFILGTCCTVVVNAEQNNPIKIWPQNNNGSNYTLCVIDEHTGVNYIVVEGSHGMSIVPRYNQDGSLYTNK